MGVFHASGVLDALLGPTMLGLRISAIPRGLSCIDCAPVAPRWRCVAAPFGRPAIEPGPKARPKKRGSVFRAIMF